MILYKQVLMGYMKSVINSQILQKDFSDIMPKSENMNKRRKHIRPTRLIINLRVDEKNLIVYLYSMQVFVGQSSFRKAIRIGVQHGSDYHE